MEEVTKGLKAHRAPRSGPKADKKALADKKKRGLSTEKTNHKARRALPQASLRKLPSISAAVAASVRRLAVLTAAWAGVHLLLRCPLEAREDAQG